MSKKDKAFYAWFLGGLQVSSAAFALEGGGWLAALLSFIFFALFMILLSSIKD